MHNKAPRVHNKALGKSLNQHTSATVLALFNLAMQREVLRL
jgi:hypothetical protein